MFQRHRAITDTPGCTCSGLPDDIINFQHDPLACAFALDWDGVTVEELPLRPEPADGWLHTRVDENGKSTKVATHVNGERFNEFWFWMACPSLRR